MPFQAVASQRLFQQVADQIAGLIRSGELAPGTRLPAERDLSKKLGVSRPIVREAMIALELSGLVEVRTGTGAYVCAKSARSTELRDVGPSALELLAARRVIEGEIAACAAIAAKDKDIERLDEALAWYRREYLKGEDCYEADRAFHIGLAEATGNAVFVHIVEQFWGDMRGPIFNRLGELTKNNAKLRTNMSDHENIRNAVAQHDVDGARRTMQAHIANVEVYFFDGLGKQGKTRRKTE
ncbi:FadR/GntR family transcriptional regulator [Methylovirgula sp. 4M-Z18]|uniref:FadR/GntR family transcriptional regulator n=1 Tax=Methylovirgula sp. 4M-Z18 TaxID=2293567 RepID=UPI000E2EAD4D|nr:FadR/GntR family transcriptional regulator [Methylovirgula sp. 4M-Z18]RFB80284.1 FadR family transcriptional regulator [Methylovirgula sp. 4M-Z18]